MTDLSLDSVLAASPQQVAAVLGDEVVILGLDEGAYFGLKGVGTRIWALLQGPVTPRVIIDCVVTEFEVNRPRAEADVMALLASLIARGLVAPQSGGSPNG